MLSDLFAVKWPLAEKATTLLRPSFWEHASPSQYIFATLPPSRFLSFAAKAQRMFILRNIVHNSLVLPVHMQKSRHNS